VAEQIAAGTVKAYVVSANQRLTALPGIPSAKEVGINYQMNIWTGVFAPKGTPKEIIAKLANSLDKALDDPSVRKRLAALGGSIPLQTEENTGKLRSLGQVENCALVPDPEGYISCDALKFGAPRAPADALS
jgi:tripartite-type tricarboxylate transporter receptor subunit TctC